MGEGRRGRKGEGRRRRREGRRQAEVVKEISRVCFTWG